MKSGSPPDPALRYGFGGKMTKTGIFVTPEELEAVKTAYSCSGMFLSGGMPMGDPQFEVEQLCKKYKLDRSHGLDLKTGEFVKV